MAEGCGVWEQKTLVSELVQGMEMTMKLKEELNGTCSSEICRELLVRGILSSYEKALLMLQRSESTAPPQSLTPISGSPPTEELIGSAEENRGQKESSKKRKTMPVWTEQVKLNSENGLEGTPDDGHSWRKYGQKDILRSKFPRSYYRCTYRGTQNCWAMKQVQRADENPSVFEITYRGNHTCSDRSQANPPSPTTEKKVENDHILLQQQFHKETGPNDFSAIGINGTSLSFPDDFSLFGGLSQLFALPESLESSSGFYSGEAFVGLWDQKAQRSESDLTEIISATASTTNSPILDLDFSLDSIQIDPNFPFDDRELFFLS